jgi:hypothetical protein
MRKKTPLTYYCLPVYNCHISQDLHLLFKFIVKFRYRHHSGLHMVCYEVLLTLIQTVETVGHQTVSTPFWAYITFIIYANPLKKHLVPCTSLIRYCIMCLVSANCPLHVICQKSNLLNWFEALIISENWMSLSKTYLTCLSEVIDTHTPHTYLVPLSCPNSLRHDQHKICTLFCCEGWNITRLNRMSLDVWHICIMFWHATICMHLHN